MPYASNDGVRIHYELEGSGPPLVLHHGLTDSLNGWSRAGYVTALRDRFRLVLIDARGHGQSDKPHETEAYELRRRAGDVTAVLDDLGVEKALFWGYSMGGVIGLALATWEAQRFQALVMGGTAPGPRTDGHHRLHAYIDKISSGGMEALAEGLPPGFRADMLKNDAAAILAAAKATIANPILDLAEVQTPCLIYNGGADSSADRAHRAEAQSSPCVRYAYIDGLDHNRCFSRRSLVLPPVEAFWEDAGVVPVA